MAAALDSLALLSALVTYRRQIVPAVREEQRRWGSLAETVPAPGLRAAALSALREKGLNAEATAVFALLAPRAGRGGALRAMTALQTAIDYLDTLSEQPAADRLANGLALHRALEAALTEAPSTGEAAGPAAWYRFHPQDEDGGYLATLVDACRREVATLPGKAAALPAARSAARRCGEGQSHTHAAVEDGGRRMRTWAEGLEAPSDYMWWETAAGASSSVAAHALIAAAANPSTTTAETKLVEAAYFPAIGALTVLLDDLVDRDADGASGEHNYMSYYEGSSAAADRLAFLADRARAATTRLRQRRRHAAILAGVAGFYLGAASARSEYASPIRSRMLESMGGPARLALAAVRLTRGR